jgi:phospholipid/cholesterol/gamma-HCH transport system permease protein
VSPTVTTETSAEGKVVVRLEGPLILDGYSPDLNEAARRTEGDLLLDLGGVTEVNTIGVAALLELLAELKIQDRKFQFLSVSDPVRELLEMVPQKAALDQTRELRPPQGLLEHIGEETFTLLDHLTEVINMVANSLYWCFIAPFTGRGIKVNYFMQQVSRNGVDAIPIVSLIMFVVGLIMALQADYQLRRMGASIYIADLVGVGLTRELGPLMAAVILSGRSGAAMAAEIGTMRVTEEIDALVTMGMNPFKFLIAPRVLGLLIALPGLALIGDAIGLFGGYLIGVFYVDLPSATYIEETRLAVSFADIFTGLFKSAAFAMIIALVGCYKGYYVKGGPEEIGKATTSAVVLSLFLVILADGFFTYLFYLLG